MAVTKQVYTASSTWTASDAADIFEDAFIDAGLMTAWHDSFADGSLEHRILEVKYDATKTYGTCYYWFIFTTGGVFISVASGWNAGSNQPSGSAFLDFYSTATNTTNNHNELIDGLAATTDLELTRYTAGGHSWFALRNGATPRSFLITPGNATLPSWLDLDRVFFHHFIGAYPVVSSPTLATASGSVAFNSFYYLRRSFYGQGGLRGSTLSSRFTRFLATMAYTAIGNLNNNLSNITEVTLLNPPSSVTGIQSGYVLVPYVFNNTNPSYGEDYHPVINGYTYSTYVNTPAPADFGVAFDYSGTAFSFGDKLIVDAGVEEWEVINFTNNTSDTAPTPLLLARVV